MMETEELKELAHKDWGIDISGDLEIIRQKLNLIQEDIKEIKGIFNSQTTILLTAYKALNEKEKKSTNVHRWVVPHDGKESSTCPKCNEKRVAEGICWGIGCDYRVPE